MANFTSKAGKKTKKKVSSKGYLFHKTKTGIIYFYSAAFSLVAVDAYSHPDGSGI